MHLWEGGRYQVITDHIDLVKNNVKAHWIVVLNPINTGILVTDLCVWGRSGIELENQRGVFSSILLSSEAHILLPTHIKVGSTRVIEDTS